MSTCQHHDDWENDQQDEKIPTQNVLQSVVCYTNKHIDCSYRKISTEKKKYVPQKAQIQNH